jgi:hypothetical protein
VALDVSPLRCCSTSVAFDLATRDHAAAGHSQSIDDRLAALVRHFAPNSQLVVDARLPRLSWAEGTSCGRSARPREVRKRLPAGRPRRVQPFRRHRLR